jgi:heme-degrading monooxygenase HmoA
MSFRILLPVEPQQPVVTFSIFTFPGFRRWWALGQMGRSALLRSRPAGLQFGKMLGSGRGGFSMVPDFSRYAMLCSWKSAQDAVHFFESSLMQKYMTHTSEHYTLQMLPVQSHGLWNNANPFREVYKQPVPDLPLVVLTRATIRLSRLPEFWRNVPKAQQAIQNSPGLLFSIGVGELPLVQQATVSIWENAEAIRQFAYQKTFHKDIVHQTRKRNWYSEDLFARFVPVAVQGTFNGKDILKAYAEK